jgi:four helix bundle protein
MDHDVDFRELPAWQRAMDLVHEVYEATEGLALEEGASVAGQLRGIAITVPAKIANGVGTGDPQLLVQNLSLAYGALGELRTLLYVAHDMDELPAAAVERLAERVAEVGKLIYKLTDNLPASHPGSNGHGDAEMPPFDD